MKNIIVVSILCLGVIALLLYGQQSPREVPWSFELTAELIEYGSDGVSKIKLYDATELVAKSSNGSVVATGFTTGKRTGSTLEKNGVQISWAEEGQLKSTIPATGCNTLRQAFTEESFAKMAARKDRRDLGEGVLNGIPVRIIETDTKTPDGPRDHTIAYYAPGIGYNLVQQISTYYKPDGTLNSMYIRKPVAMQIGQEPDGALFEIPDGRMEDELGKVKQEEAAAKKNGAPFAQCELDLFERWNVVYRTAHEQKKKKKKKP